MSKNIVICCDGTSNKFGLCNTNVVRLLQVLEQDTPSQVAYYDPGIGTLPDPGAWTALAKRASEIIELAIASDLKPKVATAYAHLMEIYEPGDQVYLFGFSRGAYTVRVLAGLLYECGLLRPGNTQLLPYLLDAFSGAGGRRNQDYWAVTANFRNTFARALDGHPDRRFHVHFIGAWDTVSSYRDATGHRTFPYTSTNPGVAIARHAISLDERRRFFRQNRMGLEWAPHVPVGVPSSNVAMESTTPTAAAPSHTDLQELWFPGVHGDVGGGYPGQGGGLWRITFSWIVREAMTAGLRVDAARLNNVERNGGSLSATPDYLGTAHNEQKGWWLLVETNRLRRRDALRRLHGVHVVSGSPRFVHEGALLHQSVLKRIRESAYEPPNLSDDFIRAVRALTVVPEQMPYHVSPVSVLHRSKAS